MMTAKRSGWRLLALVALLAAATALSGCNRNRLTAEREALYNQNRELQDELNRARAALEAAESDRNIKESDLARLRAELAAAQTRAAAAPQPTPMAPAPAGSASGGGELGFRAIEGAEVETGPGRVTVRVPGDVLFASGRAELRPESRRTLDQVAAVLQRDYARNRLRIEGYTDADPIRHSRWKSNQELSEARAEAVKRYLQQRGVDAGQMQTVGRGSANPRDTKARSRRVEIIVLTG